MSGARRVVVVGQGYVGLPLSVRAAEVGHFVVGFDIDEVRIENLRAGFSNVEDVATDRLQRVIDSGRYIPSAEVQAVDGFDVAIIAVPTPLQNGLPDLSSVAAASDLVGRALRRGGTVILESTTYPGTTEDVVGRRVSAASGLRAGTDFMLGYSPERIDPGNARWTIELTPKLVAGIDARSLASVQAFYDTIVETTCPVAGVREAEMSKLLENTFRHVNIALVNELAMFAEELGIDIWEVVRAASSKPFGFMTFWPGPGVGGHCLPIDPSYLSWKFEQSLGAPSRFVELANDVNRGMPAYVVQRIIRILNDRQRSVSGSKVLLVGFAYKANVADLREAPSLHVARKLLSMGAYVGALDPHVPHELLKMHSSEVVSDLSGVSEFDLVTVLVHHDALDLSPLSEAECVFDTRGQLDGLNVVRL